MVKVSCLYVVRGERGVLFLFPAKRPPRKNRAVQMLAPGRPTALLSAYLLSQVLHGAGLHCVQAVAPDRKITPRPPQDTTYTIATNSLLPLQEHRCACCLSPRKCRLIRTSLRAEVVMLFAVERLSERSEDWPTNGIS